MKKLLVRDLGTGNPEDSTDYESSMIEVTVLLDDIAEKARNARVEEHDPDHEKGSPDEDKPELIDEGRKDDQLKQLERTVRAIKKETKGIFVDKEFTEKIEETDDMHRKWTDTRSPHQHLRIPFSWHQELKRTFRGNEVVYTDAVLTLAYIVFCYRLEFTSQLLLRIRPHELSSLFDISKQRRKRALDYLEEKGLVERILIKGVTPWYHRADRTPGSYLYVVPCPHNIRSITYNMRVRFDSK